MRRMTEIREGKCVISRLHCSFMAHACLECLVGKVCTAPLGRVWDSQPLGNVILLCCLRSFSGPVTDVLDSVSASCCKPSHVMLLAFSSTRYNGDRHPYVNVNLKHAPLMNG